MSKLIPLFENYNANGSQRKFLACASACLAIFIIAVRRIDQILNPQLWAEDGVIFLQEQLSLGFSAIFTPYAGYLHLLPRLNAFIMDKFIDIQYVPAGYVVGQCHQDKAFLKRSLNIQNGFASILSCPIKWR